MNRIAVSIFALTIAAILRVDSSHSSVNADGQNEEGDGKEDAPVFCKENRFHVSTSKLSKGKCPLEEEINKQINMELRAFYEYLNLGYYFAHESYNLPHFSKYFLDNAKEELKHAQDLMQYQTLRGAKVNLMNVVAPTKRTFSNSCDAMKHARDLELSVTNQINKIWREASTLGDIHLADHLETHFVTEQYESLKKLEDMIGTLKRLGVCKMDDACSSKLSEFQFDKTVMKDLTSN